MVVMGMPWIPGQVPKSQISGRQCKQTLSVSNFPTTTKLLGVFVFIHVGLHILLSTANYYD